jgi:transcriptional regulator with XRE-family HTH domain
MRDQFRIFWDIQPNAQWALSWSGKGDMMQDHEPTIRSRALGNRLRKVMTAADFSGKQLADKLGWAQSTLSRLLAGKHFAKEADIAGLLAVCGIIGEERRSLLRLARDAHILGSTAPRWLDTYAEHEADARHVTEFQCVVLPEILQTQDYARTQLAAAGHLDTVIDQEVKARQERAALLNRSIPPRFDFVIHEWLLRTPVGNRGILSDQLHHLLRLSVRPFLTLRILPISAGPHAGQSGPFQLLDFRGYAPVVHHADEHNDMYKEEPEEVLTYRNIITQLSAVSLDADESRTMITEMASALCP